MDEPRPEAAPPAAWVLSGATGAGVATLAVLLLVAHGSNRFFASGDPRMFLLTARDLFGAGHGFAAIGRSTEIPYRYGRIGLPLLGWLLALGRPAYVGWTMIGINLVALTAIPGLAAITLADYDAPPAAAALVLALPAFLVLYGNVVADPLVIALLLLVFVLDRRSHPRGALVVLACAVLVKEIALLALVPLLWRAIGRRAWSEARGVAAAALPYLVWCAWLRWRVGELPFFAHTVARRGALGLPLAGIHSVLAHPPADGAVVLGALAATIVLCAAGAWVARGSQIGGLAAVCTAVLLCLGPEALRFAGETLRVLLLPQVFGLLALVIGIRAGTPESGEPAGTGTHGLFVGMPDL